MTKYFVAKFNGVQVPLCDQNVAITRNVASLTEQGVSGAVRTLPSDWDTIGRTEVSMTALDPDADMLTAQQLLKGQLGREGMLDMWPQFGDDYGYKAVAQLVAAPTANAQSRFSVQDYELRWELLTPCFFSAYYGYAERIPLLAPSYNQSPIINPPAEPTAFYSIDGPDSNTPSTPSDEAPDPAIAFTRSVSIRIQNGSARHNWIAIDLINRSSSPATYRIEVLNAGYDIALPIPAGATYTLNGVTNLITNLSTGSVVTAYESGANRTQPRIIGLDKGENMLSISTNAAASDAACRVHHYYGAHL